MGLHNLAIHIFANRRQSQQVSNAINHFDSCLSLVFRKVVWFGSSIALCGISTFFCHILFLILSRVRAYLNIYKAGVILTPWQ